MLRAPSGACPEVLEALEIRWFRVWGLGVSGFRIIGVMSGSDHWNEQDSGLWQWAQHDGWNLA